MKFHDKFKPGDIVCSDHFYNGLCMVVESSKCGFTRNEFSYRCQDLVKENQWWLAYEFCNYTPKPYNWRIATDSDIVNYLARFVQLSYKVGEYEVRVLDTGFAIEGFDTTLYLEVKELLQLGKIINERVVG